MQQLRQQLQLLQQQQEQLMLSLLRAAIDASEEELRAALKSQFSAVRFVAAYAVGERRLFWQDDLIALLEDREEAVRQSARRSLVILSFLKVNPEVATAGPAGKGPASAELKPAQDFGPLPGASASARKKAAQNWARWWEDQGKTVESSLGTGSDPEVDLLAVQLVKATGEQQKELLAKYAETSGTEYTRAIAQAIRRLSGEIRKEAREALANRLFGRTDTTLVRYLEDADAEVRRAAALALAMRESRDQVPEIAKLLLDPEPSVVRAAHAALRSLTGEDHGPAANATEEEKQEAVKAYRAWRPR